MKIKIVATTGPSLDERKKLEEAINLVNVFRINLSHATDEEIEFRVKTLRKLERQVNKKISIFADLKGPDVRITNLKENTTFKEGDIIWLSSKDKSCFLVDYKNFENEVEEGDTLIFGDNELEGIVEEVKEKVKVKVTKRGYLKNRIKVTIKGKDYNIDTITEKDVKDLEKIKNYDIDTVAISFVKSKEDVKRVRELAKDKLIISKIETVSGVKNIEKITKESDIIMVARGDLALAFSLYELPIIQKGIIDIANKYGKPVIVATQLLHSMVSFPNPTRAEVDNIATAIFQGADALMLSDETARGKYPIESIKVLRKVIERVSNLIENKLNYNKLFLKDTKDILARNLCNFIKENNINEVKIKSNDEDIIRFMAKYRIKSEIKLITKNEKLKKLTPYLYNTSLCNEKEDIEISNDKITISKSLLKIPCFC